MNGYSVYYDPEEDIIHVDITGEYDAQMLSESSSMMVKEIQRTGCTRILMDHRHAIPKLSVVEQYLRPKIAEKLGVPLYCQIAIVYKESQDVYKFIETVAFNQGLTVKIFQLKREALTWLHEPID